jgi:hypothetical protein
MKYSLYRHLLDDYVISPNYSPKRYVDAEKDEILKLLKNKNKSPLQEFVEYLEYATDESTQFNDRDVDYEIIRRYECQAKASTDSCEYLLETDFKRELAKDKGLEMKAQTLQTELLAMGWNYGKKFIKGKPQRVFFRDPVDDISSYVEGMDRIC